MACVRKRRDKWIADYRDGAGIRRVPSFDTRRQAEDFLSRVLPQARQSMRPAVDPNISVAAYAERWLKLIEGHLKTRTLGSYRETLRLHVLPELGALKVRQVLKGLIRTILSENLLTGKVKLLLEGQITREVRGLLALA